jgi:two-component system NarL family response regulator
VVRRITARQPDARILIVTTYDTDENISQALKAGAKGYLLKDSSNEQIADAIRAVAAGEVFLPPAVAAKFVASSLRPELSRRELQILGLMARGMSNKLIARELSIEETTVKTHATSLFVKLGVRSRTEALAEAARRGLITPG